MSIHRDSGFPNEPRDTVGPPKTQLKISPLWVTVGVLNLCIVMTAIFVTWSFRARPAPAAPLALVSAEPPAVFPAQPPRAKDVSVVGLHQVAPAPVRTKVAAPPRVTKVEDRYRVLRADGDSAKDVITVRLASKFEMLALREIARSVRDRCSTGKERMVLWFYLPMVDRDPTGYPFAAYPWAFGDFDGPIYGPGLTIDIRGFTAAEEVDLVNNVVAPPGASVIGRWLDDSSNRRLYTIYRRDGVLFVRDQGEPKGGIDWELVEDGPSGNGRFRPKEFSPSGDHYVINDRGDFEIRNDDGLVLFASRVVQ